MLKIFLTIGLLQVFTMLVQLLKTKSLALLLGPELVGVMAVIDRLLAVIVQTVSLSLPFAALRFLPALWAEGPLVFRGRFLRMRNVLVVMTGLALAVIVVVTLVRPATWGIHLLPYREILLTAMLGLPVLTMVPFLQSAMAGRLEHNRAMLVALGHAAVLAAAAAGVLWRGLAGFYLLYAGLGLALVIAASRAVLHMPPGSPAPGLRGPRFPLALPRPVWRFSGTLLSLSFIAPYAALFVYYRVLRDHGAETAGWMAAAIGIGLAVRGVLGSAHPVFLTPNINRAGTAADRMAWANSFQETFCFLAGAVLPPLLLFPAPAVRILYSHAFVPGATFVGLFVLVEILTLLAGTYGGLVVALDELRFHVIQNVVAQGLIVVAALGLVTPLGILGAGLAVLVAPLFLFLSTTTFLRRRHGVGVPARTALLMGLLAVSVAAAGLAGASWPEFTLPVLGLKAGIYVAVLVLFAVLLTAEERSRLRLLLGELRRRMAPAKP
jgi:PST family polysaccharide transporter